jgi:hypothetical protein
MFDTGSSAFPYPTNTWWSSWTHTRTIGSTPGVGDEPVQMHPWRARVRPSYLELVPPGVQWDIKVRAAACRTPTRPRNMCCLGRVAGAVGLLHVPCVCVCVMSTCWHTLDAA